MIFSTRKWWWEGYVALAWSALLILPVFYYHTDTGMAILVAGILLSPFGILCGISALRHGPKFGRMAGYVALSIPALYLIIILLSFILSLS